MKKPVVLAILDGYGLRDETHGNAVAQANTPNLDSYFAKYPNTAIFADGESVGLPEGQMGNSEVGHLNLGAGRVVYQSLVLINKEIKEKTYLSNEALVKACTNAKDSAIHIMGLLSDGGVHSHILHIIGMIDMAYEMGVKNIYVHPILDGRDVDPKSSIKFIEQLNAAISKYENVAIASISGRYYSMDRDKRWDRVELAYNALVLGESDHKFTNPIDYINESYENGVVDEFILPAINSECKVQINDGDSVIFANFRPDRASQLSGILTNENYNPQPEENPVFVPKKRPNNIVFVQLMKFSDDVVGEIAFKLPDLTNTLGHVLSENGLTQLRIAETEKYPHVTFFFDGGVDAEISGSERILVSSPKVATYDLQPEMSAFEVTDKLINALEEDKFDVVILNFANTDMVGHTGMLDKAIIAVETVDSCIGKIVDKVNELDGVVLITADHGNGENVLNEDESPNTAHTNNKVPFIVTKENITLKENGRLCDVTPTLLALLNVEQPEEMTGISLINE